MPFRMIVAYGHAKIGFELKKEGDLAKVDQKQLEALLPKTSKDSKVTHQYPLFHVNELKTVERVANTQGKKHWYKIEPLDAIFTVSRVQHSLIYVFAIDEEHLSLVKQKKVAIKNYPEVEKSINAYIKKDHQLLSLTISECEIPQEAILCAIISNCPNAIFYCEVDDVRRTREAEIPRGSVIIETQDFFKKWNKKELTYVETKPVYFCKLTTANVGKVTAPELKSDSTLSSYSSLQSNGTVRSLSDNNGSLFKKLNEFDQSNPSSKRSSNASVTAVLGFKLGSLTPTNFSHLMDPGSGLDTDGKETDSTIKPS